MSSRLNARAYKRFYHVAGKMRRREVRGKLAPAPLGLFKEEKARLIHDFEAQYLRSLLAAHHNNISASALAAGLDRVHLLRLLDKHGLRTRSAERDAGEA